MKIHPIHVYADTSVFGGVFDDEFKQPSEMFFQSVDFGRFELITSTVVQDEMEGAPLPVIQFFEEMTSRSVIVTINEAAVQLQQAYLQEGIVSKKWEADALHVALATVNHCTLVVSWNFKHLVHFQKIPMYNEVNRRNGYVPISIHSPPEVIHDGA